MYRFSSYLHAPAAAPVIPALSFTARCTRRTTATATATARFQAARAAAVRHAVTALRIRGGDVLLPLLPHDG